MLKKTRSVVLGMLVLTTLVGCGGPDGPTEGRVSFSDGSPVRSGTVEFHRAKDGTRYTGTISPKGEFSIIDDDGTPGLPPGQYQVVVVQMVVTEDLAAELHTHGKTVPRRYADYYTSGLKTEVSEGQEDPVEVIVEIDDPQS